jgi:hypothetical protein
MLFAAESLERAGRLSEVSENEPSRSPFPKNEEKMQKRIGFVALIAVWLAVQLWLLPKLGVPT